MRIDEIVEQSKNHSCRFSELLKPEVVMAFSTALLTLVTIFYVGITNDTLQTVKEQTDILRLSFYAQTQPEILVSNPIRSDNLTTIVITNTGYRAEKLKVILVKFYDEIPNSDKSGVAYYFRGQERQISEEIRLGEDQDYTLKISTINYSAEVSLGLFIVVKYFSPIDEAMTVEGYYYMWNEYAETWQLIRERDSQDLMCKAYKNNHLLDILTATEAQKFLNLRECEQ